MANKSCLASDIERIEESEGAAKLTETRIDSFYVSEFQNGWKNDKKWQPALQLRPRPDYYNSLYFKTALYSLNGGLGLGLDSMPDGKNLALISRPIQGRPVHVKQDALNARWSKYRGSNKRKLSNNFAHFAKILGKCISLGEKLGEFIIFFEIGEYAICIIGLGVWTPLALIKVSSFQGLNNASGYFTYDVINLFRIKHSSFKSDICPISYFMQSIFNVFLILGFPVWRGPMTTMAVASIDRN